MRAGKRLSVFLFALSMVLSAGTDITPACDASVELLITEFMAFNEETVQDEDAGFSDWIEIHNPCNSSVDVGGWYLTDDATNLTKWQFPSMSLARGEFLLVWASGKDRAVAGSPLHANFQLTGAGEYLALVKPDGTTVAQEFAPTFPPQIADVSYGLPQSKVDWVVAGDTTTYLVPTLADSGIGSAWTGLAWDDSTWDFGPSGLGYTTLDSAGFDVTFYKANVTVDSLATAKGVIADPITQTYTASDTAQVVNYLNTGSGARFGGDSPYPSTTIGQDVNDFVLLAEATIVIPTAGEWSFGVNSDDGFGLDLTREPTFFEMSYPGTRGPSDTIAVFNIPEPGGYQLRLVTFERGGGSHVELFAAEGNHSSFNSNFKLIGDTASGGLSLGAIGAQIGTNVQTDMQGVNTSIWSRVEFMLPDPSPYALMTLRAAYEDGFVAYLNGTEVAIDNAPSPVFWDSASVADRPVEDAGAFVLIDLTDQMHLLNTGTNVLALQGLNETVSDDDFLVLGELWAAFETVDTGTKSYFVTSTPAAYNIGGHPGVSDIAFFSHPSGSFTDPFMLTILTVNQDALIRYTTDGTEPTETKGTDYVAPIQIDDSINIRARVFEPGKAPSPVETRLYTMLAPDVLDFDSDLPLVIVNTFGRGTSGNFFTDILLSVIPKTGDRVSILDPAEFEGLAGLKLRGSSSTSFPKKQYAVEVRDQNFQDLDVELLDMPAQSDWILYAPYSDKSLMRNVLSYQWSNEIGRYAVRTRFVEVFLQTNTGPVDSGDYWGVYALTEKIKRDPNRVPITQLESHQNAEPEITGGYILKKDRLDPGDSGFFIDSGHRLAYVDPKEVEITPTQAQWILDWLNEYEAALYGPDFEDPVLGYEPYIDVLAFIDHHILVEVTKNIDGFRLSTFMFKDRNGKLTMGPIWDYNLSLGNANYLQGWLPQGWYNSLIGDNNYPWYSRLFADESFALLYADRWYELRRDEFRTEKMLADVDYWAAVLAESQVRNFDRWPILGEYVWPNWFIADTWEEEIEWMKGWLADRLEWMDSQFFEPPEFNHPAGEIPYGWMLTMTSLSGIIYYTTDGADPMLPDGSIAPTALEYTAPLQMISPIQIRARALDGSDWSAINSGFFHPQPLAFINEILPDNQTVHSDEQGDYDSWIELYNPFSSLVDLSGLYLTDDPGVPDKWQIPAGTTLCPHLYLLVWADGETTEGAYHANFTLNPAGGTVYLYDGTGFLLDSLTYPALLAADTSCGRRPDGGAELGTFTYPTPAAANPGVGAPIIVNEYNAVAPTQLLDNGRSDIFWGRVPGNGGEWFELVVVQDHLDLRNWSVTVEDNDGAVSTTLDFTDHAVLSDLRSGTILTISTNLASNISYDPANGDWWINLRAGSAGDGLYISALDFSLSNLQSRITIRDDLGTVVFGPAGEGINPLNGIGNDEVFKLEEDPGPNVTPYSNYLGGSSSTFGAENVWNNGADEQSFIVLRSVVQANCTQDLQCDDGNPCTDDACTAGSCENLANTATCDDGNPCTQNDVCADTQCRGDIVENCCVSDCECADSDDCTSDECINNVCVNDFAPTGTPCEDGDLCTVGDSCDLGACISGGPPDCTTLDDDCNLGVCNPADGSCVIQTTNEGGFCDDGDLCYDNKTCLTGVCQGGDAVDCSYLADDCNVGTCTEGVGCEPQAVNEGGACDDGDLCTLGATCSDGACGVPKDCSAVDDQCNVGVCNPVDGSCEPQPLSDGTGCDDGDACTTGDSCQAGVCTGGVPPNCDDSNECTADGCDSVEGCQNIPVTDGTVCDDGDLCTLTDVCDTGVCGGTAVDCSSLDDVCVAGVCNPGSGGCETAPANEGGACNDGDLCTETDTCVSGTCAGSALNCSGEDDVCHVGVCNVGTGICEPQELADGTACDDGDVCTLDTTCTAGVCGDPTPLVCDDGNSCTVDTCDSGTGCVFTPDDDQDGNSEPDPCNDGDLCTENDVCSGGVCGGTAKVCSHIGDQCNLGLCNDTTGECEALPLSSGTPCDDSDACTAGDACDAGACVPGGPANCDDGDACTLDGCDSVTGCTNDLDPGASCDDGNDCTATDLCDAFGDCVGTPVTDGTSCNDLDDCTENDSCTSGACGGDTVDCSAYDGPCTVGVCNVVTGLCEAEPTAEGADCNDDALCTENDICVLGVCVGTPLDCSSFNQGCSVGTCNPTLGLCEGDSLPDGTVCDDDNPCTLDDLCVSGVCEGGGEFDCTHLDDDCKMGVCDPLDGSCDQLNAREGLTCSDGDLCTLLDVCSAGVCVGEDLDCSWLDDDCNAGVCNPSLGGCVLQAQNQGEACDDGDLCTHSNFCNAGFCDGSPVDCSGFDDQCNVGVCNPVDGSCFAQTTNEGLSCTDGEFCTVGDVCIAGVCSGIPVVCDDSDGCTDDLCVGGTCEYLANGVCHLSGTVLYYRDFTGESEPSSKPVPGVEIDVDGDALSDAVCDATGSYAVPDLAGSYSISPLPNYGVGSPADANGAVSPFDATFIAEYMVGLIELSLNQQAAADGSGDGTISSLDAALVAQLSVGLLQHLPIADDAGSDWLYLRCDNYVSEDVQDCTDPLYDYDPLTQAETTPFHAILYGDVTGNWSPAAPPPGAQGAQPAIPLTPEQQAAQNDLSKGIQLRASGVHEVLRQRVRSTPATLTLEGWSGLLRAGERRELTLKLADADGIEALDLILGYDPALATIVEVKTVELGEQLSLATHNDGRTQKVAMYGLLPLQGSGVLLSVTIEAQRALSFTPPVQVKAVANEGGIPLQIDVPSPSPPKEEAKPASGRTSRRR